MKVKVSKKYTVLVLLTLLLILALARFVMPGSRVSELPLATVSRTALEIKVNSVGALDAERAHMVSSTIKGDKGKVVYLIDDGTMVKSGDMLVRFDSTPFEAEILRLSGEVKSRESVVESSKQVLEWEKSQAEGLVKTAEFNLKDARQEYSRHKAYIKDLEELGTKGFSFPTEIAQAKKKAEQLSAKHDKAETDLEQAKKESVFKIASAMAALSKAKSELETVTLALEDAKGELKKTVLTAPFQGIVVHYELFRDNLKRKPRVGDTVWQNQALLYLPDISSMVVKTQVREVDLHKIAVGQKASVQVDAYPDALFESSVSSIGVLAADNADGGRGEKYFQLAVAIKGSDSRLRPGMTARVHILADTAKNVLSVPVQAVFEEAGHKYAYVHSDKTFKKVEVSTGRQNEDMAEILSGLKEGEQVSLLKPSKK